MIHLGWQLGTQARQEKWQSAGLTNWAKPCVDFTVTLLYINNRYIRLQTTFILLQNYPHQIFNSKHKVVLLLSRCSRVRAEGQHNHLDFNKTAPDTRTIQGSLTAFHTILLAKKKECTSYFSRIRNKYY